MILGKKSEFCIVFISKYNINRNKKRISITWDKANKNLELPLTNETSIKKHYEEFSCLSITLILFPTELESYTFLLYGSKYAGNLSLHHIFY